MNNEKNMGPVRSSDEAKKRGRNGCVASGKSRRRKKEVRALLKEALNCAVVNPKVKSMMKQGITPAHAGKTVSHPWHRSPCRDYPRVCGENRNLPAANWYYEGSPPRMRGKLFVALLSISSSRITPTRAGKFHNFSMY